MRFKRSIRPLRLAFVTRPTRDGLFEAAGAASKFWAGQWFPIIPLRPRKPADWGMPSFSSAQVCPGMLRFFRPDFVIRSSSIDASDIDFEPDRTLTFRDLARASGALKLGLDVTYGFEAARRSRIGFESFVVAETSKSPSHLHLWLGLLDERRRRYFQLRFPASAVDKDSAFAELVNSYSAFQVARAQLYCPVGPSSMLLFDGRRTADLFLFWNLRAAGHTLLPIDVSWRDSKGTSPPQAWMQVERPTVSNILLSPTMPTQTANTYSRLVGPSSQTKRIEARIIVPDGFPRMPYFRDDEVAPSALGGSRYAVETPCPLDDQQFGSVGLPPRWVQVLQPSRAPGFSATAPTIPLFLHGLEKPTRPVGSQWVWPSVHGLAIGVQSTGGYVEFKWPSGTDVFSRWFEQHGYGFEISEPGHLANALLRQLDGLSNLRLLGHERILTLLNLLNQRTDDSKEHKVARWKNELETVRGKRSDSAASENHLRLLVSNGILRLGLKVQCETCGNRSWHSLDRLSQNLSCQHCLATTPFPHDANTKRAHWSYKVSGPLASASKAQGSITVLLLARLLEHFLRTPLLWTPSFRLSVEDQREEVDFAAFTRGRHGQSNLVLAECKTLGGLTAGEIDRLIKLQKLAPGYGYIVAASLVEHVADADKRLLSRRVKSCNGRLIVLTRKELVWLYEPPIENKKFFFLDDSVTCLDWLASVTQNEHL